MCAGKAPNAGIAEATARLGNAASAQKNDSKWGSYCCAIPKSWPPLSYFQDFYTVIFTVKVISDLFAMVEDQEFSFINAEGLSYPSDEIFARKSVPPFYLTERRRVKVQLGSYLS